MADNLTIIRPQAGFQESFLSSPADIVIGGGAAGSGKTFALLIEPLRHKDNPKFAGIIFRRTTPQIRNEGGLWQTSLEMYSTLNVNSSETLLLHTFPKGARLKFNHLEYEKNLKDHQGAQYAFIGFDELTHFSKKMFFDLLARNRSMSGVQPYVRATCNPDPDSWVAEFISWWIDQESGFPVPERDGKLRYFMRDGDTIVWGDTKQDVLDKCQHVVKDFEEKGIDTNTLVKSVTFIRGSIYDNHQLLTTDPAYLGNLMALDPQLRAQMLEGNWKIAPDGLALFEFKRIADLFTNCVAEGGRRCVTVDVARFGRDLAVIMTWEGLKVVRIDIFTKSKTTEITAEIEKRREEFKIAKGDVLVDQDGVGGGVVDEGDYIGFSGGASVLEDPQTKIKENYSNLKTQCVYRMANRVNAGEVSVDLNFFVDGVRCDVVKVKGSIIPIIELIKKDLRSFKRAKADQDGKQRINDKASQKNILDGRSPDFGDSIIMREYFEFIPQRKFSFVSLG